MSASNNLSQIPEENSEAVAEYSAALTLIEAFASAPVTSDKTAVSPISSSNVAVEEARLAIDSAGKKITAVRTFEERERSNLILARQCNTLEYPLGSMVRHDYNITISYCPNVYTDGSDCFEVVGDVCDANYGGSILTSCHAEAKIPKKSKLDLLAFDRMVQKIAADLPKLVLTALAEEEKEKCLQELEKARELFANSESDTLSDDEWKNNLFYSSSGFFWVLPLVYFWLNPRDIYVFLFKSFIRVTVNPAGWPGRKRKAGSLRYFVLFYLCCQNSY